MRKKVTVNNIGQASAQLGIAPNMVRLIKKEYNEAFNANQTINIEKLKAYYETHKDRLIEELNKSTSLKDKKLLNDITLQELEIAKKKGQMLPVDEICEFLYTLGLKTANLLLQKLTNELPQRLDRVEPTKRMDLCKEVYNEIVAVMKCNIDNWVKEKQNETTDKTS
jgi:hypothetical protein